MSCLYIFVRWNFEPLTRNNPNHQVSIGVGVIDLDVLDSELQLIGSCICYENVCWSLAAKGGIWFPADEKLSTRRMELNL